MKYLCYVLVLSFLVYNINAQEKEINGIVTSAEDGLPLPGATIVIKGTSKGTQTDFDGKYSVKAKKGEVLVFSYLGFLTKEVKIKRSKTYNVALETDNATLDEVVVVSAMYDQNKSTNSKINRALQGQMSGVNVIASSTSPGTAANVRVSGAQSPLKIRGTKTGNGVSPLYILNGKPISEKTFSKINSKQIKEIKVLKDSSATALYGSRAINGVVVVKTIDDNLQVLDHNELTNESYDAIKENDFERVSLSPLSTFSIDVDKAAYSNIRRMINNGDKVKKDAVKIEEMINYFNYNYLQPTGEHPFKIQTNNIKTPWNNDTQLVRIGLQGKRYENDALPASNLTFLIDVSGSMNSPNKLGLLKSAFKLLINQLRAKDKVSIVVYAGAAGVVLEPTSGDQKEKITAALQNLSAGGSTAGGAGIELAYKLASKNFKKNGNNRVILATDGDFNVGASSNADMQTLIENKRKSGVFLSVLGFGYGNYKDSKLETLADKGNGNHAYIDTMQEARKVFGKEFGGTLYTIAKDVKIQVEFNPNKVQAYRLIGYENRLLNDEDFIDDTIDAGELGSGHNVTALYEIIPVGVTSEYLKPVSNLKYTSSNNTSSFNNELFTVKFRYKKPDGDKSIEIIHTQNDEITPSNSDMNFVSAVALFGMQLRGSKYYNKAAKDKVLKLAELGRGTDKEGYRAEFIRLVKSYNKL